MAIANYINSPSFETTGYGSAGGQTWTTWHSGSASSTIARSPTVKLRGSQGLRIEIYDGTAGATLAVTLPATTSAQTWTFSFDLTYGLSLYSPYCDVKVAGGSTLVHRALNAETRYSIQFTQNPGVTSYEFEFGAGPGFGQNKTIGLDGLRLVLGTDTTYVDGHSPGYAWAGTIDESATVSIYSGVFNHWPRPRTTSQSWTAFWEASGQTAGGMTVTNGLGGVSVSGTISRSSTSTYKDVGASSGSGAALLPLYGLPAGTAYVSATTSGVSGLGPNDQIKLLVRFHDAGKTALSTVSLTLPAGGGRSGSAVTVPSGAAYAFVAFTISTPSGFTSSNHTVAATLDYIRIATQADTSYLDGDTAGYTWRGTSGDAPTIDVTTIQAAGSTAITGGLESKIQIWLEGQAALAVTGTLDVYLDSVQAAGSATITGSAALWQYGPVSAGANVAVTADIVIAALIPIEASGATAITGSAEATIAVQSFANAVLVIIGGTLETRYPDPIEGAGSVTVTGTVVTAIAGQTEGIGELHITGLLEPATRIPRGAFGDLAIFGVSESDPLRSITSGSNGGTQTGANGAEWVRIYAEFAAPQATAQWRRAAYAAVGIQFASVAAGDWQEFTYVQAEVSASGGPTPYRPAASLRPLVYPDRLNVHPHVVSVNPGSVTPITSPITGDPTGGLRVPVTAGGPVDASTALDWLRPGATYTLSMWVSLGLVDVTDLSVTVTSATGAEISSEVAYGDLADDAEIGATWRRFHLTFTAPDDGRAVVAYDVVRDNAADDYFDIAGMLAEEGMVAGDYFWPDGSDPDFGYRSGYSDATGGIFHYKDRLRRTYILKQALRDQVPTGIGIETPEFFLIPHVDV